MDPNVKVRDGEEMVTAMIPMFLFTEDFLGAFVSFPSFMNGPFNFGPWKKKAIVTVLIFF